MIDETLFTMASLLPFVVGVLIGGVIAYFICQRINSTPVVPISGNLITNSEALEMIGNFEQCNDDDTVSGHIDLGVLLNYIKQMSRQCSSVGLDMSGLEYYFAKYGKDGSENENRSTIVMYPTYNDGLNHVPIDPFLSTQASPATVVSMYRNNSRTSRINDSRYVLNRLHMSPPRQPTI